MCLVLPEIWYIEHNEQNRGVPQKMNAERLCAHVIQLIHVPIHIFDGNGKLLAVHTDHGEQQDVFSCDNSLIQLIIEKSRGEYPVFFQEPHQILYGIVKEGDSVYVLGPCCVSGREAEASAHLIRAHSMDPSKLYKVPRLSLNDFIEAVMMIYEAATGRIISREELLRKNFVNDEMIHSMRRHLSSVMHELRESASVHNPYSQELREQEAIREGDLDALNRSFGESFVGRYGILSPDPLRQMKDMAIVVITLASRSAIAGGLVPETAFSMSDAFIQHIEEMQDIMAAGAYARQAEIEYCMAVHELTAKKDRQNPLIIRCKSLIVSRLHSKLSVKDIAGQLDITPGYLSHLFLHEEGIKLSEYIIREKIEASKKELVYLDKPLDEVAYSFGFASQSHFGQAFKKYTGMTPKTYREKYGIRQ